MSKRGFPVLQLNWVGLCMEPSSNKGFNQVSNKEATKKSYHDCII